jgi:hypothetical protein
MAKETRPKAVTKKARGRASSILMIAILLMAVASSAALEAAQPKSRITVASDARLRAAPAVTANEVARLQLGTVIEELEQSASKEKVGGVEDYWYRVSTPDGRQGWIFGSFSEPFDQAKRAEIYRRISAARLKIENASFAELTDLVRFLTVASGEVKERQSAAELEFARLVAMRRALDSLSVEQHHEPPYKNWIDAREESLTYSEPAGRWYVRSQLFWDLQARYSGLALADHIAWQGATNQLPGECEGYMPCFFYRLNITYGKYLGLYPRGAHAQEALDALADAFASTLDYVKTAEPPAAEERKESLKELAALRSSVLKSTGAKRATVLEQIAEFEKHYGAKRSAAREREARLH